MRTLSRKGFEKAREFIYAQARPLDQRRFERLFEDGPAEAVGEALMFFQNEDGGLGRGIEPDFRLPDSSAIATATGLDHAREARLPANHPLVSRALDYLLRSYDPAHPGWQAVPPQVNDYPHAPWWTVDPATGKSLPETLANPAGHVLAMFNTWPGKAPANLVEDVTRQMLGYFDQAAGFDMESLRVLCGLQEAMPPGEGRDTLQSRLVPAVGALISRDPGRWAEYGPQPLEFVRSPDSPLVETLAHDLEVNLDYRVDTQNEDGSWSPNWSWGEMYPQAWEQARREWQGSITVDTLKLLQRFDRLEETR